VYQISVLTIVGVLSFSLSGLLSESQPEVVEADGTRHAANEESTESPAGKRGRPKPEGLLYRTKARLTSVQEVAQHAGPPLARVYQRLLNLRRQHTDFMVAGEIKEAKKLQRRIAEVERRFRYPAPAPHSINPRVHAIGIYSSREQPVRVRVTDTSAPVVLVLTAYSAACWAVEADDDVQVDFVICTGYHKQTVDGLPLGVPVFSSCYDDRAKDYAYAYGPDRKKWDKLTEFVRKWTGGLEMSTVTGGYYSAQEAYVVGPENADWRIQMLDRDLQ
jgi:hypothetical protein